MHLKNFLDSIYSSITAVCNYYYDLISGRFGNPTVLALKDIVLQLSIVQKFTLNVMFGHHIFVMNSYFGYVRTSQQLGILICKFVSPDRITSASFRLFLLKFLISHAE